MRKRIFNAGNFPEGGKKRRRIARRRDILSAVLLDKGGELGTAQGTGVLADDFAVLVNEDGRDAADAVFGGNLVAFINVVLGNDNLAGVGVGASSRSGPSIRQGAHHGAQKSTNTGLSATCLTSASKLESFTTRMFSLIFDVL